MTRGDVAVVLSCEHGGNDVPPRWRHRFPDADEALRSHEGWDPGALPLAEALAESLSASTGAPVPLVSSTVTRLLVEANRSTGHPRLFSRYTRGLSEAEREELVETYWRPHREAVAAAVTGARHGAGASGGGRRPATRVLHLGVHTFTPVLDGRVRDVDVGLLYDPRRPAERALCGRWARRLAAALPDLRIRRNRPYRGAADGLTTTLRHRWADGWYLGVELEVSQALVGEGDAPGALAGTIAETLTGALTETAPADIFVPARSSGDAPTGP